MVSPAAMIFYMKKDRFLRSGLLVGLKVFKRWANTVRPYKSTVVCTAILELNYLAVLLSACAYSV